MASLAATAPRGGDTDLQGSYLDPVELIETHGGGGPNEDLHQLLLREVFGLPVRNRDDHRRNHALNWDGRSAVPDRKLLMETAPFYRLADPTTGPATADEVAEVMRGWSDRAKRLTLPRANYSSWNRRLRCES